MPRRRDEVLEAGSHHLAMRGARLGAAIIASIMREPISEAPRSSAISPGDLMELQRGEHIVGRHQREFGQRRSSACSAW